MGLKDLHASFVRKSTIKYLIDLKYTYNVLIILLVTYKLNRFWIKRCVTNALELTGEGPKTGTSVYAFSESGSIFPYH